MNVQRQKTKTRKTHGDAVPVLVHHHDAEEHAEREEKEAIDVVLDGVADGDAEGEEEDLGDAKEGDAKEDVT